MLQVELSASVRNNFGKGAMRRLRGDGNTPAVLYGVHCEPIAIQLETNTFYKELLNIQRRNAVVTLALDNGDNHYVLIKDIQVDPVRDTLVHADFQKIDVNKPKCFGVDIKLSGTAKGVDVGGFLHVEQNSITLEGLPLDIPDFVELDISDLGIGDSYRLSSLELPANVTMISDKEQVCVKVDSVGEKLAAENEVEEEQGEQQ